MSTLKMGFGIEDRLVGSLQRQQFDVAHDATLDHEYKLDFVVRRFPNIPKFYSLGVQVTTRPGDLKKMQEFLAVHTNEYLVADKVLYIEIDPKLDFERGVGLLVATGMVEFQFSTQHLESKLAGLRINADMTYSLFKVSEAVAALARDEMASRNVVETITVSRSQPISPPEVVAKKPVENLAVAVKAISNGMKTHETAVISPQAGFINAFYRTKDHGFITEQKTGNPFFFHLAGVSDGELRDVLLRLPEVDWAASVEGTVEFVNAGKTRPNARYPEAKGVRFLRA